MQTFSERNKKFWERMKKEQVLRWMASLTVTMAAAVTIVVVTAKEEPLVRFNDVSAVGNNIIYHAEILDPGSTFVLDSLVLDIKGSLETYSIPLTLGQNSGTQTMRYLSSDYTLSIRGSQGFGLKTFASKTIRSNYELSGAITAYRFTSSGQSYLYEVDTLVYNKDQMLQSIWLRYGYTFNNEPVSSGGAPIYELPQIPITSETQTLQLEPIPSYSYSVHLFIEGSDGLQTYALGELIITNPTSIQASLWITDLSYDYVELSPSIYPLDVPYTTVRLDLYDGAKKIASQKVPTTAPAQSSQSEPNYEQSYIRFDNLLANHNYEARLVSLYLDNISGKMVEQFVSSPFTTTHIFSLTMSHQLTANEVIINITTNDPNNVLNDVFYTVYETIGDYEQYSSAGNFTLMQTEGNGKHYQAIIPRSSNPMKIEVQVNKQAGSNVYFSTVFTLKV